MEILSWNSLSYNSYPETLEYLELSANSFRWLIYFIVVVIKNTLRLAMALLTVYLPTTRTVPIFMYKSICPYELAHVRHSPMYMLAFVLILSYISVSH